MLGLSWFKKISKALRTDDLPQLFGPIKEVKSRRFIESDSIHLIFVIEIDDNLIINFLTFSDVLCSYL